jgi:hypothetical protein
MYMGDCTKSIYLARYLSYLLPWAYALPWVNNLIYNIQYTLWMFE